MENLPLLEGWARPITASEFHYYVGFGGIGGSLRSLCRKAPAYPADAKLREFDEIAASEALRVNRPENGGRLTVRIKVCVECLERIERANALSFGKK